MGSILVLYHSQEHGNTAAMAKAIAQGAVAFGAQVECVNTNLVRLDPYRFAKYSAVAFGSPDYYSQIAGGLKTFLDDWYMAKEATPTIARPRSYGLFCSHGGGGAVARVMEKLFAGIGTQLGVTIESEGAPDRTVEKACWDLGWSLAKLADQENEKQKTMPTAKPEDLK